MSSIKPDALGAAIAQALTMYSEDVQEKVDAAGKAAVKELERITKDTAPYNAKAHHRHFVDCIATKAENRRACGRVYVWYVKAPCYRLTHLLVNGHATRNGGRVKGNPFLKNAVEKVLPEYEKDVKEACR
jgi:hypothetical protein